MANAFDEMIKEATSLPWAMGARLMVELRNTVSIPEEPVLTKSAALGLIKMGRIGKIAQTPEEAQMMAQEAAMTDPNMVAALDHQEAANERAALMGKIQELQMANEAAQTQVAMANQAAQAATQQSEQTQAMLEQAHNDRIMSTQESMAAKDETLRTQVSGQQHRHQIAQAAEQMAEQLKSLAATSPEEQQMQQQQAMAAQQEQQMAAEQAAAGVQGGGGAKKKTQKEVQEAQTAAQQAQVQGAQAEQAQAQEQAEMGAAQAGMAAPPPGAPAPDVGGMAPKMGSAKGRVRALLLQKRASAQPASTKKQALKIAVEKLGMKKCSGCGKMAKLSAMGKCSACDGSHKTASLQTMTAEQAAAIEKRAQLFKQGRLGKADRDAATSSHKSINKVAEGDRQGVGPLGTLGFAAAGAGIGGGREYARLKKHQKQYGSGTPTEEEMALAGKLEAIKEKIRQNPSYINKLRQANVQYKHRLERMGREHPEAGAVRAGLKGAITGVSAGPVIYEVGKKAIGQ